MPLPFLPQIDPVRLPRMGLPGLQRSPLRIPAIGISSPTGFGGDTLSGAYGGALSGEQTQGQPGLQPGLQTQGQPGLQTGEQTQGQPGLQKGQASGGTDFWTLMLPLLAAGIGGIAGGGRGALLGGAAALQGMAAKKQTDVVEQERGFKQQQELRRTAAVEKESAASIAASGATTAENKANLRATTLRHALDTGIFAPTGYSDLDQTIKDYMATPDFQTQRQAFITEKDENKKMLIAKRLGAEQEVKTSQAQEISARAQATREAAQATLYTQKAQDNQRYFDVIHNPNVSDEIKADAMSKVEKLDGTPYFSPEAIQAEKDKGFTKIGDMAYKETLARMVNSGNSIEIASVAAKKARQDLIELHGGKYEEVPLTEDQKKALDVVIRQNVNKTPQQFEDMVYLSTDPRLSNPQSRRYAISKHLAIKAQGQPETKDPVYDWVWGDMPFMSGSAISDTTKTLTPTPDKKRFNEIMDRLEKKLPK